MEISSTLPEMVCSECVTATLETAPFVLRCRDVCQKWSEISDNLSNLQVSSTKSTKSLCVLIGENTINTIQTDISTKTVKKAYQFINKSKRLKTADISSNEFITGARFECPECGKDFPRVFILNKHLKESGKQMCGYCAEILDIDVYLKHLKIHGHTEYICKRCREPFRHKGKYLKHLKLCNRKGSYVCVDCSQRFTSASNLVTHHSTKHRQSVCKGCNKKFKSRACFKNHKKHCANSQNLFAKYICDYCKKEYSLKTSLRLHIRNSHQDGWVYQCAQCGKRFSNPSHLKEHDNLHNPVHDRFPCSICEAKYSTRRGFERHMKRHVDDKGDIVPIVATRPCAAKNTTKKLYKCLVCQFVSIKHAIKRHLKNRHQKLPWEVDGSLALVRF
ncbi:hypothetical protein ACJJTC_002694 [Scirpophaga incertulas]